MAARSASAMTPEEREAKVAALRPQWAQDYIRQLEALTRTLHQQLTEAREQGAGDLALAHEISGARDRLAALPDGIKAPEGEYATARVLDGRANMEPVADLPEGAEVRWVDFFQVRYGDHEATAGARALVVAGDGPLVVRPVDQDTIIIARG